MGSHAHCPVVHGSDKHPKKLILAAADFAEEIEDEDGNKAEPPPELILAWQVQQWGYVAVFGDQPMPANMLRRMSACLNYYNATISYIAGSHNIAEWARANPVHLKMTTTIREMRTNHDR